MDGLVFFRFAICLFGFLTLYYDSVESSECNDKNGFGAGEYKGRYFQDTVINHTSVQRMIKTPSVYSCRHVCSMEQPGCIASSYMKSERVGENCQMFNLTNVQRYFTANSDTDTILILPMHCGRNATVDGKWSDWVNITHCSASCGEGNWTMSRNCTPPYCNGDSCLGNNATIQTCKLKNCDDALVSSSNNHSSTADDSMLFEGNYTYSDALSKCNNTLRKISKVQVEKKPTNDKYRNLLQELTKTHTYWVKCVTENGSDDYCCTEKEAAVFQYGEDGSVNIACHDKEQNHSVICSRCRSD